VGFREAPTAVNNAIAVLNPKATAFTWGALLRLNPACPQEVIARDFRAPEEMAELSRTTLSRAACTR
jgi:hypothetical protein